MPINTHHYNFTEPLSLRAGEYQIIPVMPTDISGLNRAAYYVVTVHARGSFKLKLADSSKTVSKLLLPAMKVLVDSYRMKVQQQQQTAMASQQAGATSTVSPQQSQQQIPPNQVLLPFQRQSAQFKPLQEAAGDEVDIQYVVQPQEKSNSPPDMAAVPSSTSSSTSATGSAAVEENGSKTTTIEVSNDGTTTPATIEEPVATQNATTPTPTSQEPTPPSTSQNEALTQSEAVISTDQTVPTASDNDTTESSQHE